MPDAPDVRPDLPQIALGEPLAGHWVKIDTDQIRMSDFRTLESLQEIGSDSEGLGAKLHIMGQLLRLMAHVVVATSLPGETIEEALGDLRASEFAAVTNALNATATVPKAS